MEQCQIDQMRGMRFVASADQISHNAIVYAYDNGCVDIIAAPWRMFREPGWERESEYDERPRPKAREAGKKSEGEDQLRSMRRARAKLRRLALANDFEYFVTLTLDQTRIDRYDPKIITKALNTWCDNMVRRNGLRYILVPELHRDGALHFHGFFAGDNLSATDSGHRDHSGAVIYNLPQWKLGFSTAIRLRGDYPRAVAYVCKYIGKQEGNRPMGRWYYSGGRLREPTKLYTDIDYQEMAVQPGTIEFDTPGGKMAVRHTKKEEK